MKEVMTTYGMVRVCGDRDKEIVKSLAKEAADGSVLIDLKKKINLISKMRSLMLSLDERSKVIKFGDLLNIDPNGVKIEFMIDVEGDIQMICIMRDQLLHMVKVDPDVMKKWIEEIEKF